MLKANLAIRWLLNWEVRKLDGSIYWTMPYEKDHSIANTDWVTNITQRLHNQFFIGAIRRFLGVVYNSFPWNLLHLVLVESRLCYLTYQQIKFNRTFVKLFHSQVHKALLAYQAGSLSVWVAHRFFPRKDPAPFDKVITTVKNKIK